MPALKKRSDILNYVTPQELEANYVRAYQATGMTLTEAISAAKESVRQITNPKSRRRRS